MSESADAIKAIENEMLKIKKMRSRIPIRIRTRSQTAAKAAKSSATTNSKPTTRSAAKNKEDTPLSSSNQALTTTNQAPTTNKRNSFPRAAKDKTALATTSNSSNGTTNNSTTKRKSSSNVDGRKTKEFKEFNSDKASNEYQSCIATGNVYGPAKTNEDQALRALGVESFRLLRRLLDGTCQKYAVPFVLALKHDSPRALKLLGEGKVPQVLPENLGLGELLKFHAFKVKETPKGAAESNFRSFATALEISDQPNNKKKKESILKLKVFPKNGVLPSSKNPTLVLGAHKANEKKKREEHIFFKEDCCNKHSVTFFGKEGRTLRWYYTREGNWNRQYIESLEKNKKTNALFKALLWEEGKKSINELEF